MISDDVLRVEREAESMREDDRRAIFAVEQGLSP